MKQLEGGVWLIYGDELYVALTEECVQQMFTRGINKLCKTHGYDLTSSARRKAVSGLFKND